MISRSRNIEKNLGKLSKDTVGYIVHLPPSRNDKMVYRT